jgi:hypothetical protein
MMHHPFQIARWALMASFAVIVFVVGFPNPRPSAAWKLAEQTRYQQRFPVLRPLRESSQEPPAQWAHRLWEPEASPTRTLSETPRKPVRTAQLPSRYESGDDRPRGAKIQEPVLSFEEEVPATGNLAPDPAHLETPSETAETLPVDR